MTLVRVFLLDKYCGDDDDVYPKRPWLQTVCAELQYVMYDGKPKDGQLHDGNENKYRETLTLTT